MNASLGPFIKTIDLAAVDKRVREYVMESWLSIGQKFSIDPSAYTMPHRNKYVAFRMGHLLIVGGEHDAAAG